MTGIAKNSKLPIILSALFVSLAQFSTPAFCDTFCDRALKKSDSYVSPLYPQINFRVSEEASVQAASYGISPEELEVLVGQSKISSYERGGRILLPLFRTVRTDEIYRDYIFLVELRKPFLAGRRSDAHVLQIEKVSEKNQKVILNELADRLGTKPQRLKVRIPGLRRHGYKKGPVIVQITASVLLKLQLKHKINLTLIKMALEQTPDRIIRSDRADDRVEMFYFGEKIMLTIVLGRMEKNNTTSLVTSYFTQRLD